jgi:cytochrome P450
MLALYYAHLLLFILSPLAGAGIVDCVKSGMKSLEKLPMISRWVRPSDVIVASGTTRKEGYLKALEKFNDPDRGVVELKVPGSSVVLVSDPKVVDAVLKSTNTEDGAFTKWRVKRPAATSHLVGDESIFSTNGEQWEAQSRQLKKPFSPAELAKSGTYDAISATIDRRVAALKEKVAKDPKASVDMRQEMNEATFEAALSGLFGMRVPEEKVKQVLAAYQNEFRTMREDIHLVGPADLIERLQKRSWQHRPSGQLLDSFVDEVVAYNRKLPPEQRTPLMKAVLDMKDPKGNPISEAELHQNMMFFMTAGHETTSSLLGWTFYHILKNPEVRDRIATEASHLDPALYDKPNLSKSVPYTDDALSESMRLNPPVYMFLRESTKEFETVAADGTDIKIPKKSKVVLCPYLSQRFKSVWGEEKTGHDADAFVPERKTPSGPEYKESAFGRGPRVCLGKSFATQESLVALSKYVREFPGMALEDPSFVPKTTSDFAYRINEPMMVRLKPEQP